MKKRILIVGSSGFLGKIFSKEFNLSFSILKTHIKGKKKIDLAHKKKLYKFIDKKNFYLVLNLAGGQHALKKKNFITENLNLIKICNKNKVKIIFFSTSLVYSSSSKLSNEKSAIKSFNEYTKNKILLENLYKKLSLDYKIIRLSNVYDNDFSKSGIFYNIKKNIYLNKSIYFNDIDIVRNYIHTNDVVNLLKKLLFNYENIKEKIFNFGNENLSIFKILKLFEKIFKKKIDYKINKIKKYDPSIKVNNSLAKKVLKYNNRFTLRNTIIYSKKNLR